MKRITGVALSVCKESHQQWPMCMRHPCPRTPGLHTHLRQHRQWWPPTQNLGQLCLLCHNLGKLLLQWIMMHWMYCLLPVLHHQVPQGPPLDASPLHVHTYRRGRGNSEGGEFGSACYGSHVRVVLKTTCTQTWSSFLCSHYRVHSINPPVWHPLTVHRLHCSHHACTCAAPGNPLLKASTSCTAHVNKSIRGARSTKQGCCSV